MLKIDFIEVSVSHCARCGDDHSRLTFKRLTNATDKFEFWAMCPVAEEPILMALVKEKK